MPREEDHGRAAGDPASHRPTGATEVKDAQFISMKVPPQWLASPRDPAAAGDPHGPTLPRLVEVTAARGLRRRPEPPAALTTCRRRATAPTDTEWPARRTSPEVRRQPQAITRSATGRRRGTPRGVVQPSWPVQRLQPATSSRASVRSARSSTRTPESLPRAPLH